MANLLVQTPRGVVPKMQLYATIGGGFFRERFDALDIQETGSGTNVGGGAKIELAGPLRLRLDYRVFKFTGDLGGPREAATLQRRVESGVLIVPELKLGPTVRKARDASYVGPSLSLGIASTSPSFSLGNPVQNKSGNPACRSS